jgi:hypothetical protein
MFLCNAASGARVDEQCRNGSFALRAAVQCGDSEVVQVLLASIKASPGGQKPGAGVNLSTVRGSALHAAVLEADTAIPSVILVSAAGLTWLDLPMAKLPRNIHSVCKSAWVHVSGLK